MRRSLHRAPIALAYAALALLCNAPALLADDAKAPGALFAPSVSYGDFVRASSNELVRGGNSVRLWGRAMSTRFMGGLGTNELQSVIGYFNSTGCNMVRAYGAVGDDEWAAWDKFFAEANRSGILVWNALPGASLGYVTPEDVDVLDDAATGDEWAATIASMNEYAPLPLSGCIARMWDPRLELLFIKRFAGNARRFNNDFGYSNADNPQIAIWELAGVDRWRDRMLDGEWLSWPGHFRASLLAQWNNWLYKKYGSDAALRAAWGRESLSPAESLDDGLVFLAPLRVPPAAGAQLSALLANHAAAGASGAGSIGAIPGAGWISRTLSAAASGIASECVVPSVDRMKFSRARAKDVREFLNSLWNSHNLRVEQDFRQLGKSTIRSALVWHIAVALPIQGGATDSVAIRMPIDGFKAASERLNLSSTSKLLAGATKPCFVIIPPGEENAPLAATAPWRMMYENPSADAICMSDGDMLEQSTNDVYAAFDASFAAAGAMYIRDAQFKPASTVVSDRVVVVDEPFASAYCGPGHGPSRVVRQKASEAFLKRYAPGKSNTRMFDTSGLTVELPAITNSVVSYALVARSGIISDVDAMQFYIGQSTDASVDEAAGIARELGITREDTEDIDDARPKDATERLVEKVAPSGEGGSSGSSAIKLPPAIGRISCAHFRGRAFKCYDRAGNLMYSGRVKPEAASIRLRAGVFRIDIN